MKEKIIKLLSVKSIVTIVLTFVFAYLSAKQIIAADQFLNIFTVIIAFYFGTQHERTAESKSKVTTASYTDQTKE